MTLLPLTLSGDAVTRPKAKAGYVSLLFGFQAILGGAAVGLLVTHSSSGLLLIAAAGGLIVAAATFARLEWGLLALVFITYSRVSDVAVAEYGAPSVAKFFVVFLLGIVVLRAVLHGERPTGWVRPAALLAVYGVVGALSLFYAAETDRAQAVLSDYVKDMLIAVLVVVLLQRGRTLRRVVWVLLAVGIFLGTIGVVQYATGSFDNNFLGFGRAGLLHIVGQTNDYRISGPLANPNAFGQILLVIVPLAFDRLWNERSIWLRVLAGWALAVTVLAIVFTFSRGAFLGLVVVIALVFLRHPPRPAIVLLSLVVVLAVAPFIPAEYTSRISSLQEGIPFLGGNVRAEASLRGRTSEMTVGWRMFADHPIIGVGWGNYPAHYQTYSRLLGLDPRRGTRSPHSLYLQVAAETGLLGLAVFGLLLWQMYSGLLKAQRALRAADRTELADIVVAFTIGITGYLTHAVFIHGAYPRFFWLLVGIAFAAPLVARTEAPPGLTDPDHADSYRV